MTKNIEDRKAFEEESSLLWVIVRCSNNILGFDASTVGNMIAIPKVTRIPSSIDYMSGTITIRDSIIPLVDLRIYTGQLSGEQEIDDFCLLMNNRLIDHQSWIKELKASVDEKREFKLATDPHKCAFGKWYDNYKSDDRIINSILARFDAPHKLIHGIAEKVTKFVKEDKINKAHELIDMTSKNELMRMVGLFSDIKEAVREAGRRRIAMVLETKGRTIALDIDEVIAVEHIDNIEDAPKNESSSIGISRIGRRDKDDGLVLLMENVEF